MRIKIIGDNNCARATRHLLRLAGFAVTEFLPADAVTHGPLAGYAITIDLAPAPHTPDSPYGRIPPRTTAPQPARKRLDRIGTLPLPPSSAKQAGAGLRRALPAAAVHFDSVDSALEAAVLRHVTQLAAAPVIVDRPGGVVHSDRELRIVAPNTGDAKADEAAAVAIEFGVLRGLLDLTSPAFAKATAGKPALAGFAGKSAEARVSMHLVNQRRTRPPCSGEFPERRRKRNGGRLGLCCSRRVAGVSPAIAESCA